MRVLLLGLAVMALAGCGGETYPVPSEEAFTKLSGLGYAEPIYPLPAGLYDVTMNVESVPGDGTVKWQFSDESVELATVTATVDASGDKASTISVSYAEGTAAGKGRTAKLRQLIQTHMQPLIVEAIDSKFENRPYDVALRAKADALTTMSSVGDMMKEADQRMTEHADKNRDKWKERDAEVEAMQDKVRMDPSRATRPSTDLNKYR